MACLTLNVLLLIYTSILEVRHRGRAAPGGGGAHAAQPKHVRRAGPGGDVLVAVRGRGGGAVH